MHNVLVYTAPALCDAVGLHNSRKGGPALECPISIFFFFRLACARVEILSAMYPSSVGFPVEHITNERFCTKPSKSPTGLQAPVPRRIRSPGRSGNISSRVKLLTPGTGAQKTSLCKTCGAYEKIRETNEKDLGSL